MLLEKGVYWNWPFFLLSQLQLYYAYKLAWEHMNSTSGFQRTFYFCVGKNIGVFIIIFFLLMQIVAFPALQRTNSLSLLVTWLLFLQPEVILGYFFSTQGSNVNQNKGKWWDRVTSKLGCDRSRFSVRELKWGTEKGNPRQWNQELLDKSQLEWWANSR